MLSVDQSEKDDLAVTEEFSESGRKENENRNGERFSVYPSSEWEKDPEKAASQSKQLANVRLALPMRQTYAERTDA